MKIKTNEDFFKALFKDLDSIEVALLRERVLMITDLTEKSMKEEPQDWNKGFVSPHLYVKLIEKIRKHLDFDKQ